MMDLLVLLKSVDYRKKGMVTPIKNQVGVPKGQRSKVVWGFLAAGYVARECVREREHETEYITSLMSTSRHE